MIDSNRNGYELKRVAVRQPFCLYIMGVSVTAFYSEIWYDIKMKIQ